MSEQPRELVLLVCPSCKRVAGNGARLVHATDCPIEARYVTHERYVHEKYVPATAQARERGQGERVAELEEVLTDAQTVISEIAKLLGPVGPDEVLDQDKPAASGRRWILSDENGMRITRAYRLAHTFVIAQRYDAALASGDQGEPDA